MAAGLVTADTSVVVPLVSRWHAAHAAVVTASRPVTRLPAHVVLESFAALTSLPHGLAVSGSIALRLIRSHFPDDPLVPSATDHQGLLASLESGRLRGGQVYDALIAATALGAGAVLLTRDHRAESTYRAIGVETRFLG